MMKGHGGAKQQQQQHSAKTTPNVQEGAALLDSSVGRRLEHSSGSPTTPTKGRVREKGGDPPRHNTKSPGVPSPEASASVKRESLSHTSADRAAASSSARSPSYTDTRRRGSDEQDDIIGDFNAQQRQQHSSQRSPGRSSPNSKTVAGTKSGKSATTDTYSPSKSPQSAAQGGAQRSPQSPRRTLAGNAVNGAVSHSLSSSNGNERRNSAGDVMPNSAEQGVSGSGGIATGGSPTSLRSSSRRKSLSPSRSPKGRTGATDADALRRLADSAADSMNSDLSAESVSSTSSTSSIHHVAHDDVMLSDAHSAESSPRGAKSGTTVDQMQGRDEEDVDVSGDALLNSQNAPTSLSATLARGAHHQCGTARRVKVYELKGEVWFDRGTGYCAGVYDEQNDAALLVARMEETCRRLTLTSTGVVEDGQQGRSSSVSSGEGHSDDEQIGTEGREDREHYVLVVSETLDSDDLLLKARVVKDDVYQRQQDTLVVWTEPDGTDMALSFQEADGCHEVWEFLAEVQKHFLLSARGEGLELDDGGEGMTSGMLGMSAAGMTTTDNALVMSDGSPFAMPEPRMDNLAAIEMTLKDAASRSQQAREKVAQWILREDYAAKLAPVFQDAEDLEQLEALHRLCAIVHTIIMLNDNVLIERLLRDDVFISVVGMLEYDPEFPRLKASYRDYLLHTARFRQVVPIPDEIILTKIHQTFRLQYLKDVILARTLDDSTFAVLNSLIFYHQADIVVFCTSSEAFLSSLFGLFEPNRVQANEIKKAEAIIFLQQLCAVGKQVQLPSRLALYRTLTEWGLLVVLEYALSRKEARLRNAAAEILMTIIEYDASGVRMHILEQVEPSTGGERRATLLTTLASLLHEEDGDPGLKTQVTESLRILFDSGPDGATGGPVVAQTLAAAAAHSTDESQRKDEADRFLNWFYDGEVDTLFTPLKTLRKYKESQQAAASPGPGDQPEQSVARSPPLFVAPASRSALLNHLCELLTFVMAHHHFRSQYWVISSDIGVRVASLLFAREKHLRLAALRFFRACLAKDNQFINRHFVKIGLLSAILAVVEAESARDNLVTSACLEFFEHIRKENIKPLINHLMDKHEARVRTLTRHNAIGHYFQAMILQWERSSEVPPAPPSDVDSGTAGASSSHLASFEAERERRLRDMERRGGNRATMDTDEENYFHDDDDDDDDVDESDSRSGNKGGLSTSDAVLASSIAGPPPAPPPTYTVGRPRSGSGLVPYAASDDQEGADDFAMAATNAAADLSALSDSIGASSDDVSEHSTSADTSHGDDTATAGDAASSILFAAAHADNSGSGNTSGSTHKRKVRASEEDDDDEDGMMGRLAKRKSLLPSDGGPTGKTARAPAADAATTMTAGAYENDADATLDAPSSVSGEAQKAASDGAKRLPITLSSSTAERVAKEGKNEES